MIVTENGLIYKIIERPDTQEKKMIGPSEYEQEEGEEIVSYSFDMYLEQYVETGRNPKLPLTVDEAKTKKLAELKQLETEKLQTFKSAALVTEHTYLSSLEDMVLLDGEYGFVKGDDYDLQPIIWYTVEAGNVEHTKEQFIQVYLDARNNVKTVKYHRADLEGQVAAALTIEEVMAIVW